MKIILSRKGFDSDSGGGPSPILPDGKMLSLPIPDRLPPGLPYHEVTAPGGKNYGQIIEELNIGAKVRVKGAHLDPDLVMGARPRPLDWLPALGLVDQPAGHLRNQDVSIGDLFLFFGWFRHTEEVDGKLRFLPDRKKGFHAIFGYLEIGEIIRANEDTDFPRWLQYHPHAATSRRKRSNNTIYIATPKLSCYPSYPGASVFKFNDCLVLTKKGESKSRWNLNPEIFQHLKISHHSEDSWKDGYFQSADRGQEFVIRTDEKIIEWARNLIKDANLWQH